MKSKKHFLTIGVLTLITAFTIGGGTEKAFASAVSVSNPSSQKSSGETVKDTDTVVELSSGVRVHGEIEIYDMSEPEKPILSIDTNRNSKAKTIAEVKKGAKLEPVQVPDTNYLSQFDGIQRTQERVVRDRNTPPTQLMKLGSGARAAGGWTTGNYWHYTPYAYAPTSGKALHFWTWLDSMLAGDSEDWNNTHRTGVGYGVYIPSNYEASYPDKWVVAGVGNVLACWSWGPRAGSTWEVTNY